LRTLALALAVALLALAVGLWAAVPFASELIGSRRGALKERPAEPFDP